MYVLADPGSLEYQAKFELSYIRRTIEAYDQEL